MIETVSPKRGSLAGPIALVLACISLALSLVTCAVIGLGEHFGGSDLQSAPEVASASQVEAVAHVTLPPGAVMLSAAYSNGLETQLSAKFRLPRNELDSFIASAAFTAPPTPGLRAVTAKHNVGGGNLWKPETAKTVSGIDEEQPTADGTRRALLVDLGVPDSVTVYLYAGRG
ncbi:hypothetical protein V6U81_06880 [Micromonospora sp. CPCC 205711]|uniref:hypothetical protein n=1 Tax=Micromonospora sp. CPCC 205547 TaxID=3122400 RepID=UPI002FF3E50D